MKKIIYSIFAASALMLATTSCTEDRGTTTEVPDSNANEVVNPNEIRGYDETPGGTPTADGKAITSDSATSGDIGGTTAGGNTTSTTAGESSGGTTSGGGNTGGGTTSGGGTTGGGTTSGGSNTGGSTTGSGGQSGQQTTGSGNQ